MSNFNGVPIIEDPYAPKGHLYAIDAIKWAKELAKVKDRGHEPYIKLAWGRSCQPAWICKKCLRRLSEVGKRKCKPLT